MVIFNGVVFLDDVELLCVCIDQFCIGYVGCFLYCKGLDMVVEVFVVLCCEGIDVEFWFVGVVFVGNEGFDCELRERVVVFGVEDCVVYFGF